MLAVFSLVLDFYQLISVAFLNNLYPPKADPQTGTSPALLNFSVSSPAYLATQLSALTALQNYTYALSLLHYWIIVAVACFWLGLASYIHKARVVIVLSFSRWLLLQAAITGRPRDLQVPQLETLVSLLSDTLYFAIVTNLIRVSLLASFDAPSSCADDAAVA